MEVVLLENIKNLGQIGDVVFVKRGHGRNFLIKYGKALKASKENINLVVTLNSYNSYEERLLRGDILMTQQFTIPDLIDKNFSENLWTKCYIKIKELVLNQITEDLKKVLASKESEGEGDTTSESINTDPNTGIETDNIVDTIPAEYQYLLEIDDHFN